MLDERTGLTHDYTRKSGVAEAVILTPATAPAWCTNRAELWNAVEKAGTPEELTTLRGKLNSPSPTNCRRMPHGKPFSPLSEKTLSVRGMIADVASPSHERVKSPCAHHADHEGYRTCWVQRKVSGRNDRTHAETQASWPDHANRAL